MIERRKLLRGLAAAGAVGSAGCIDSASNFRETLPSGGSDGPRFLERWLSSSMAAAESDGLATVYVDLADVRAVEETLLESVVEDFRSYASPERRFSNLSATVDDVDDVLVVDGGRTCVLSGSFDEDAVVSNLESAEPDELYEYEGYTVYRTEERSDLSVWTMAVGSGTIIQATPDDVEAGVRRGSDDEDETDEPPAIERLIDTGEGNRDRLPDVDDDVAALLESVDSPTMLEWGTFADPPEGLPADAVGTVISWSVDERETTAEVGILFADEAAAEEGAARDAVEQAGLFDHYDDGTFGTEGRLGTAKAATSTEEFNFFAPPEAALPSPRAGLQFDHGDGAVTVTITSIDRLDEVTIRRDGEAVEVLEEPSVGDSVVVDVSSGDTITAVGSVEGGESAVIGMYDA